MAAFGTNFYFPPSRLSFVNQLQGLVAQGKFVAIEGPSGIGKTVIVEEVLTAVLPDANKCYVTAAKNIDNIQMRSRIIEQLFGNVLFDPEKPLLSSFLEFNQQTQLMIVVDNAHFLSGQIIGEMLQLFSELNTAGINLSVIVTFDKQLSSTLYNVQSSLLSIQTLPPLNKEESYQLLKEYFGELPPANNHRVKRWIEASKGLPIQLLAYDQNSDLAIASNFPINLKLWVSVIVSASVLLALTLYAYNTGVFSEQHIEDKSVESMADSDDASSITPEGEPEKSVIPVVAANPWGVSTTPDKRNMDIARVPAATVTAIVTANPEEILASILQSPEISEQAPSSTSEPAISNNLPQDITKDLKVSEKSEIEDTVKQAESTVESTSSNENAPVSNEKITSNVEPEEENVVSEPLAVTEASTLTQMPATNPYNIDNQAFFTFPPDQYVLQLTAVSSEETLAKYLTSAPVPVDSLNIYQIRRNGKAWIVVTHGLYSSIAAARQDAANIDPNAWAKSVSVIQQQIRRFNQEVSN